MALDTHSEDILKTLISMSDRGTLSGCFADIPVEVYHHADCPGISSTQIKSIIKRSYRHLAVEKIPATASLEFGSAFHCFVNEPELFLKSYQILIGEKNEQVVPGKIGLSYEDLQTIKIMQEKIYQHPDAGPLLREAQFELTYFSRDSETGVLKKCRVDAIKNLDISDLKSCVDASVEAFQRSARKYLYGVSGAYYTEVVSEVIGERVRNFNLIACEHTAPHEINVFRVSDQSIQRAGSEIRKALKVIQSVEELGDKAWGGYELGIKDIHI